MSLMCLRERFEDDCLLSTPSRADNQELEFFFKARRRQHQSSPASYKNHEYWSPNLSSLQTYFSDKCSEGVGCTSVCKLCSKNDMSLHKYHTTDPKQHLRFSFHHIKVLNGDHREISVFPPFPKQQALHRLTAFVETYYYHISPCREGPDVR